MHVSFSPKASSRACFDKYLYGNMTSLNLRKKKPTQISKNFIFQSIFLQSVCPHEFFGEGCANKCEDNCNGCNNVTGLCDFGCFPGWNGKWCRESTFFPEILA